MRNRTWTGKLCGLAMIAGMMGAVAGCQPATEAEVRQEVRGVRQTLDQAAGDARRVADNAAITGRVKATLGSWKGLDASAINVDTKDGVVFLKGDVKQPEQAELAERVAMQVEGVQRVENQLTIRVPAKSVPSAGTMPGAHSPTETPTTPGSNYPSP